MAKKIVKKTKIKLLPCFMVLLFFVALSFGAYYFVHLPIQNLIVEGTSYLKDDYILNLAGVRDYPSFYLISTRGIEDKLEESPYIQKAEVKREFFHVLVLDKRFNYIIIAKRR